MNDRDDTLTVNPGRALRGALGSAGVPGLPGDKSLSHRAALFAALAEGESRIENFLVSGVTRAMLAALDALGVPWELSGSRLLVSGPGLAGLAAADKAPVRIDCGNSATTLRLLAGALAAAGVPAVLDGSPGLRRRPMERIVAPLQAMGVPIRATDGCAPLTIGPRAGALRPLDYRLPVASAQVKSCLLLAALAADGPTRLIEPGPSRYHTERMLGSMGAAIRTEILPNDENGSHQEWVTYLTPPRPLALAPLDLALPGDISAAAFLIVAALITPGSQVSLPGVGLNPTRTGLLDALQAMGADIRIGNVGEHGGEPAGDLLVSHSRLQATQVSGPLVVRMIDEFPAFAVAAAYAEGQTVVSEADELRHKESDRISALCGELRAIGVQAVETADGFVIAGGPLPQGGEIQPHGDHRLAMSLAVAGLAAAGPVQVREAGIIHESFPAFAATLQALGGDLHAPEAARPEG